jgi:protease IV
MTLFELLKSIVIIALALYIGPFFMESIKKEYIPLLEPRTHIGVISAPDYLYNAAPVSQELRTFFTDPAIKGIVIKINGSQSAAGTSQTIFHEIRYLKKEYPKPIVALIENSCLSGAYLIATACDYIIAPESALIGGIGTLFNEESLKKLSPDSKINTEALEAESYQQLTKHIALARKLSLTTINNWAEGKIFTGNQALALGLINETGSLHTVIKIMKEKALVEDEIEWISLVDRFSLSRYILKYSTR